MTLPKILVAGFGPFPGAPGNPSAQLALSLGRSRRAARFARVRAIVVPTVYAEVLRLPRLIEREKADGVLMFGLAARTPWLRIETRAQNHASLLHADAARAKSSRTLVARAPAMLRINAPVRKLLRAARDAGVQARLSRNAGSYICNAAIFHALHATRRRPIPIAFVHIPAPRGHARAEKAALRPAIADVRRAAEAILIALAQSC